MPTASMSRSSASAIVAGVAGDPTRYLQDLPGDPSNAGANTSCSCSSAGSNGVHVADVPEKPWMSTIGEPPPARCRNAVPIFKRYPTASFTTPRTSDLDPRSPRILRSRRGREGSHDRVPGASVSAIPPAARRFRMRGCVHAEGDASTARRTLAGSLARPEPEAGGDAGDTVGAVTEMTGREPIGGLRLRDSGRWSPVWRSQRLTWRVN